MKINNVKFSSFRQHRNVEFDFTDENGNLVIIRGNNGAGKTTFLHGLTWCLYDTIDGKKTFLRESLISQSDVIESKNGDTIATQVSIAVTLGTGVKATITRGIEFVRTEDGVRVVSGNLTVLAQEDKAIGYVNQVDAQEWIDAELPTRFSPYFLIDGEHLRDIFKETDARFIKDSVLQIAQVDILALTTKHLETVSDQLIKEAAKHAGTGGQALAAEFERLLTRISEKEVDKTKAIEEVNRATDLVNEANDRLGDIAVTAQLMEQRKRVEESHKRALSRVQVCEDELASWALQSGPTIFIQDSLQVLREKIDQARREQVLPPPFDPAALEELLEAGECICGRDLLDGSDSRIHIEHVVAKYGVISEVGDALSRLEGPLLSSLSVISRGQSESKKITERLRISMEEAKSYGKELEKLNLQLAGLDDAEVALLHNQLKSAEIARDKAIDARGRLSAEIDLLQGQRDKIEKEIASQRSQSLKAREAIRKSNFARSTMNLSRKVYEELSGIVRKEVATNLDQQFKKMIWKQDFIDEVGIDDSFRISVVNNRGFEILSELSQGEKICLAFAYSLTLANVAGIRFPLVVDSPMGKLNPEVQDNLSEVITSATNIKTNNEDQQLILLMTDTEYTPSVKKIFAKRNAMVYSIDFDVAVSETTITREL
jgi:DNA sulfur modification protein DndD